MLKDDLRNIAINDLLKDGKISVRTKNCCFNTSFETLFDIVEYYENGQQFSKIRNAGKKTCLELEDLCNTIIPQIESVNIECLSEYEQRLYRQNEIKNLIKNNVTNAINKKLIVGKAILSYLDITKRKILEQKFLDFIKNYSIRTKNRLKTLGFREFIISFLFVEDNVLLKIDGLGQKSLKEAIDLKYKMKEVLLTLIDLSEEEISRLNMACEKGDFILDRFVDEFYKANNHLPMFYILEQHLIKNKNRSIEFLIDSFPIFKDYQYQTLDKIGKKYNLTRERVRQIRYKVFHKTFEITDELIEYKHNDELFKYSELLGNKDDWKYITKLVQDTHIINQMSYDIDRHIMQEKCSFSVEFVMQLIGYIFKDEYTLYGGFDTNSRDKLWKSVVLIKKRLTDVFDFEGMRKDFCTILTDNQTEYLLDIEEYIKNSQRWIHFDFEKLNDITSIVKDILLHEFGLYAEDVEGNLIKVSANKKRTPLDVVYEILQACGEPMHLEDIFVEFKRIIPEHKYAEAAQLRPYLQRHEAISYRNRKSVYTLKEWKHIKTGTIRDAIIEFLLENDLPQKADDITEYVLKYFPETNIASIRTTMFNDTKKRFSFFKDNFFGLKEKEYPSEYDLVDQEEVIRKSFEQRLLDLELFILEEGHFPFTSSKKNKEDSLGRWWYRINTNKQNINNTQQAEIDRVNIQYAEYNKDKTTYEWNLNYIRLKCFLLENRRIPFASENEYFLYRWLKRAKEDFENYNLTEEQRQKYIDLVKLI